VEVTDVSRIVVLNGDVNEILFALGMGDRIVANDITGYYPEESKKKPKIGYGRTLSAETILSFKPTLILGNTDAGPPAVLTQLRSAGVPLVIVDAGQDVSDSAKKIRRVGAAVGLSAAGEALGDATELQVRAVHKRWTESANRFEPRAAFLYLRGPRTQLIGGSGTRANAMLLGAGATDAGAFFANVKGYVPITSEALVLANPDVIVVLDDGLESVGGIEGLLKIPGIALTKAGQNKRIISFDDLKLLELGPRTPEALDELSRELFKPYIKK
jgi:iron complex transport system substrate-binding protein